MPSGLQAEEPPYLRFVQGLREKQLPDLALQYLDALQKKKLAPELAAVLTLEAAKARLDLATLESDPGQRAVLQNRAHAEFEAFVHKNPKHPLAADAYLEMARIVALQGKAQLARARRQESRDATRSELAKTRIQFEQAGKQLEAASGRIEAQLANYVEPKTPEEQTAKTVLTRAKLQAEFERGINLLDQAQTYVEQSEFAKRGDILKRASKILDKVANQDSGNAVCLLARVWLGRCYWEMDDPKAARKVYETVLGETGDHADAARRLALYFRMHVLNRDPDVKNPLATFREVERMGVRWLAEYGAYANTPEGFGVRFELANAYVQQSQRNPRAPSAQSRDNYQKARKLYQDLEQSENEYAEEARKEKLRIVLHLSEERSRGVITQLKDFEECYLRAQVELARMDEAEKKLQGEKLEKAREEHHKNLVQALTRAVDLADAKVSPGDLSDARYLLARAYYSQGDLYRAIVVGEDLARTAPLTPRAPLAGTFALYAYAQLVREEAQAPAGAGSLDSEQGTRGRMRRLAEYIEKKWPTDAAADVARHQLGLLLFAEKKHPEAVVAVLARISPSYPYAIRSQYLLAAAALQAHKADVKPPAGQPPFPQRALTALQGMPELPPGADADTVQVYAEARLLYGGLLYTNKEYKQLQVAADALQKRLAAQDVTLDEASRAELRPRVKALELLARLGEADTEYRAGHYAKVAALLEPYLNQLKDPSTAAPLQEIKHPGLLHGILGLAMRAYVQDNKLDRAKDALELLQKTTAPENSLDLLKELVGQLSVQIRELRQQGAAAQDQYNQTVQNFSVFLDELAKQKDPKPELILFLAESYSSLDKHKTAAELLGQVPEPKPEGEPLAVDPKRVGIYRAARVLRVRELRLDGQFARAKAELEELLGTPERPGWGQAYFEVKKERLFLLEDQEKFGGKTGAILEWTNLLQSMQKQRRLDARVNEQYFECYYYLTRSIYKNALTLKDKAKSRKGIQLAANYILKLEELQPDMGGEASKRRFEELLQEHGPLREAYEELKRASR